MKWDELIDRIYEKTEIPYIHNSYLTGTMLEIIVEEVAKGEKVLLTGLGTFESRKIAERSYIGPNGERIEFPAVRVPHFKASKEFKELLKK